MVAAIWIILSPGYRHHQHGSTAAAIRNRYDDPFSRGFEYVPFSDQDHYGPIKELGS